MSNMLEDAIAEAFGEPIEIDPPKPGEVAEASEPDATPVAEQPAPSPPRDEKGRFASQEDPDVQKYLERFGGDVDKALHAAVEADRFIGRQGQEKGELQKELEQIKEMLKPEPEKFALDQGTVDWFDEIIAQSPAQAVSWALQNDPAGKEGVLFNRAMDSWYEEEPRAAAAVERRLDMAALAQQFEQSQQPLRDQAQRNEFVGVWSNLRTEIPDLDDYAEAIMEAANDAPEVVAGLQAGTAEAQKRVIRNLYKLAKFDKANQLASGEQPPPTTPQVPHVASQTQNAEADTRSAGERWAEENLDPHLERYTKSAFEY